MRCTACGHENREGARFCGACATSLVSEPVCSSCGAENPAGQKFCDQCGAQPQGVKGLRGSGLGDSSSSLTPNPVSPNPLGLHARHLAEKILQSEVRPRGRAQAGDGALRRREGLDGAGRAARPRRVARDPRPLLPDPDRRRAPLRGHGQPVHRRRHHGAVRRADRARGPRAARLLRGAASARRAAPLRRRAARRARLDFSVRMGINSGEVVVGKIGDDLRMDYTAQGHTVGLAQRMEQLRRRTASASPSTRRAGRGLLRRCAISGEFAIKGVARAGARLSSSRAWAASRTRLDLSRARGSLALRRPRRRDGGARGGARRGARRATARSSAWSAEAGTGKSRLCFEFVERCRARGLHGLRGPRCPAHGKNDPVPADPRALPQPTSASPSTTRPRRAREKIAGELLLLDEALPTSCCRWCSTSSASPIPSARRSAWTPRRASASSSRSCAGSSSARSEARADRAADRGSALDRSPAATPSWRRSVDAVRRQPQPCCW